MKVIIAGGRDIKDKDVVYQAIQESGFDITEVISGDAKGVDKLGAQWGYEHHLRVSHFPAEWETYGKSAGPRRNGEMCEYGEALILVWDGSSRGSADILGKARKKRMPVYEKIVKTVPSQTAPAVSDDAT